MAKELKMELTIPQQQMVEDGFPPELFRSPEQRAEWWKNNPPRPMPSFSQVKERDPAAEKLLAELEEQKRNKAKTRIHKMLSKKEDRTGQRWDVKTARWVNDSKEKAVISITTNTRGATKMTTKDYAEMSLAELANAYNKKSGLPPIKKFKDKPTGLKKMAELMSKPKAAAAESKLAEVRSKAKAKPEPKAGSTNKRAAEFGARVDSFREKLLIALDENFKKQVAVPDLLKAVYGSKNTENQGALTMVLKGAQTMIEKNKLPYTLKKEKNADTKELSFGLYPKS